MCKCNEQCEEIMAVKSKVARMVKKAMEAIPTKLDVMAVDEQVAKINSELFDNMTKEELLDGILDGDTLSLDGLLARDDVKKALEATQEVHVKAFEQACSMGGKIHSAEVLINETADELIEDLIIYGFTANISGKVYNLSRVIKSTLNDL